MKSTLFLAVLVMQFISNEVIASEMTVNSQASTVDSAKPSTKTSSEDYSELFPGPSGEGGHEQQQQKMLSQPALPTYESWDVLRQYPRYAPVPKSKGNDTADGK